MIVQWHATYITGAKDSWPARCAAVSYRMQTLKSSKGRRMFRNGTISARCCSDDEMPITAPRTIYQHDVASTSRFNVPIIFVKREVDEFTTIAPCWMRRMPSALAKKLCDCQRWRLQCDHIHSYLTDKTIERANHARRYCWILCMHAIPRCMMYHDLIVTSNEYDATTPIGT